MTIKLGYTNCKFYKCPKCPAPYCYQSKKTCEQCESENELVLHVSFIDSPGHNDLQATALSGASNVDFCLLLAAANCKEDPETNEHYKTVKILNLLENTFILHNKIDLVTKEDAYDHYDKLKQKYNIKHILPICAQFGFGINYLIQFLVEKIPKPINNKFLEKIKQPLKGSIIRSFDVNKVGTDVKNISGAVIGGTIKTGTLKIGDMIKIIPGIVRADGTIKPLITRITSLKTDNTDLYIAYPGGLIGIGTSLDASLAKEDKLVGNIFVSIDDIKHVLFKKAKVSYTKYDEDEQLNLKQNDICSLMLGSSRRNIRITTLDTKNNTLVFETNTSLAGIINDNIVITKNNKILLFGKITNIM